MFGGFCGSGPEWSVGSDGWTIFSPSPDTVKIYVSSVNGNDSWDGTAPAFVSGTTGPLASLSAGHAKLRNFKPDWLLLEKGSTFNSGVNGLTGGTLSKSGRSQNEPMLICSYGTGARPILNTNGVDQSLIGTIQFNGQNLAVVGLKFFMDFANVNSGNYKGVTLNADTNSASPTINMTNTTGIVAGYRAWGSGINGLTVNSIVANTSVTLSGNPAFTATGIPVQFNMRATQAGLSLNGVTNLLIVEDCEFNGASLSLVQNSTQLVNPALNLRIRRNVFVDCAASMNGGGLNTFIGDNNGPGNSILIEENTSDHCGWNASIWGEFADVFSHNFYLHDNNPPITFTRNITSNASSHGAQIRNGGTAHDNLAIGNAIAFLSLPGIQPNACTYDNNVIANGYDIRYGVRTANAVATSGTTVTIDGIITSGNATFVNAYIKNLDNPGSISGTVSSSAATTVTMSSAIVGGLRGNGVQIGDRLQICALRGQGLQVGASGSFSPAPYPPGGNYPIGTTTFYFFDSSNVVNGGGPLPGWVVPGMNFANNNHQSAFPGTNGITTIASVAADRQSLTTTDASTVAIGGGEQWAFSIWNNTGGTPQLPAITLGPNNIFINNKSFNVGGGGETALTLNLFAQNVAASGNYFYNWAANTANNIVDNSLLSGTNTTTPTVNLAASTTYPNASVEAYDASIRGNSFSGTISGTTLTTSGGAPVAGDTIFGAGVTQYTTVISGSGTTWFVSISQTVGPVAMTSGSADHFIAQARLNSKDSYDARYTANACNNYIRTALGLSTI